MLKYIDLQSQYGHALSCTAIEDAVPTVLVTITGIITLTKGSDFWLKPY